MRRRYLPFMSLLWSSLTLAPVAAEGAPDDAVRLMIRQCPEVKARLDSAFSTSPDFESIGDAVNKRIAQCEYFKELGVEVGQGVDAVQQCRAGGAVGIDAKQVELRSILRRIKAAAIQYCD